MQIIVNKQIGIEAETVEEGIAKVANGEGNTISISANARPQQPAVNQGMQTSRLPTRTITQST
jgi:hypothetical protein